MLDRDDLVLPLLLLEPAPLRHVIVQGRPLAIETEPYLALERRGRPAQDLHVPASILLRPAARKNAEVHEKQLNLLTHLLAGRAEDDALLPSVSVTVEVGA